MESSSSTTSKDSSSRIPSRHSRPPVRTGSGNETDAAIIVNVGGVNYTTTVATLKAVESSYFSLMLNGLWEPTRTGDGNIFVDRSGELFGYILEHLRGQYHREVDTFQLPDDLNTLKALLREAEFYQLPALVSRLNKRIEEKYTVKERTDSEPDYHEPTEMRPTIEFDIAYSAVSSAHPQFSEELVHELASRVNYEVFQKYQDGFTMRDVNTGVLLDQSEQALPYSMFMQVVLVREGKALCPPPCAVAPAAKVGNYMPMVPYLVPHQRAKPSLRRPSPVPSSVQSPILELGQNKIEAVRTTIPSMSELTGERYGYIQASRTSSPSSAPDPLQQVAEARLSLQALVAEYASKTQPQSVDRSKRGHLPAQDDPLNALPNPFGKSLGDRFPQDQSQYLGSYPPVADHPKKVRSLGRDLPEPQSISVQQRVAEPYKPDLENAMSNPTRVDGGRTTGFASQFGSSDLVGGCNDVQQVMHDQQDADTFPGNGASAVNRIEAVHSQLSVQQEVGNYQQARDAGGDACGGNDYCSIDIVGHLDTVLQLKHREQEVECSAEGTSIPDAHSVVEKDGASSVTASDFTDDIIEDGDCGQSMVGQMPEDEVSCTIPDVHQSTQLVDVNTDALPCDSDVLVNVQTSESNDKAEDSPIVPPDSLMLGAPVCILVTPDCQDKAQENDVICEGIPAASDDQAHGGSATSDLSDDMGASQCSAAHQTNNEKDDAGGSGDVFEVTITTAGGSTGTASSMQNCETACAGPEDGNQENLFAEENAIMEGDNRDAPLNAECQPVDNNLQVAASQEMIGTVDQAAVCKPPTPDPEPILTGTNSFNEPMIRDPPTPDREAPGRQTDASHTASPLSSSPAACDSNISQERTIEELANLDQTEWNMNSLENTTKTAPCINGPEAMEPSLDDPLLFGLSDAKKQPVHVNVNVANVPGAPGALLSPPKYSRLQNTKAEDGQMATRGRPLLKAGTLFPAGADHPPQSQSLQKKSTGGEEIKARSRIPRLNLAPVISGSRGNVRAEIGRSGAEIHDHRDQLAGSRGLAKHAGLGGKQQGKVVNREVKRNSIPIFQRTVHRAPGPSNFSSAGRQ